jgi:serine/threonine protein kinase
MKPPHDVKLIDFALATRPKGGLARIFSGKTKIQGTRSYMSPEQIRGQNLDMRADIYSFGCMIYELVGGKPPYTGTSTNDLLSKHLRAAVPPLQGSNRNASDAFSNLVRKTLSKNPDERPESMQDFLREFEAIDVFKIPPKLAK